MGKLTVRALRVMLAVVLTGTVFVQALMVWALVSGNDPGVILIMGGVGAAILGVALIVLVLRTLLTQAVARDVEATQLQAELDEAI
ncbi:MULTISPECIES: DUF2975 domain-containing protein [unclassified Streptomyces]|uniref:DUF2975 domain-containing protein n=1 Tax=Streptomyces TaxID=1883 RepID=UPI000FD994DB|nr:MULTISPECIES: DUF2975 domain-containing protein [unclassified Streptomyces]UQA33984.1 DUF2975 domain-containing protein [Streptomyces sp. HNA39]